jgi:hypothetical protein
MMKRYKKVFSHRQEIDDGPVYLRKKKGLDFALSNVELDLVRN